MGMGNEGLSSDSIGGKRVRVVQSSDHDAGLDIPAVTIFISGKQPNSTMTLLQRPDIIGPITTHHSHVASARQVRN